MAEATVSTWDVSRSVTDATLRNTATTIEDIVGSFSGGYREIMNNLTRIATGFTASELKESRELIGKRGRPVRVTSSRDVMTKDELDKMAVVETMFVISMKNGSNVYESYQKIERAMACL